MALGNINIITVTGTFRMENDTPAAGTVTFTTPDTLLAVSDSAGNLIVVPQVRTVTLNGSGFFTIPLIATNDPDANPTGFTYQLTANITNAKGIWTFSFELPYNTPGSTIDLADLVPGTSLPGNFTINASQIPFTPTGTISSTDVQSALAEVASEGGGGGGAPTTANYLIGTANAGLSAEIVVGTTPGGELGGTWATPTIDATHSGSSHASTQSAAEATAAAALAAHSHTATQVAFTPTGTIAATNVQTAIAEVASEAGSGGGAPTTANYLVGTADGTLSAEIVVGTTPGGELGGTWASPTIDATHSGSSHASTQAAAEATAASALSSHLTDTVDAHAATAISFTPTGTIAATTVQAAIAEVASEAGTGGGAPTTVNYLVGTADGTLSAEIVVGTTPGGELGGTWASPTVDATHSGSTHAATQAAAEATASTALTAHLNDTVDAHDASAISFVPTGTIAATTVQAAIAEVAAEAAGTMTKAELRTAMGLTVATTAPSSPAVDDIWINSTGA